MIEIPVKTGKSYCVKVGSGLLSNLSAEIAAVTKATTLVIVSDSNIWPLYGNCVSTSLSQAGYQVLSFVFPPGEDQKNGETYLKLLTFLAENQITRSDCLIALGGGVVGDLCGFAAATYLRGIDYIQIPTTLLAMVDSSVGGKNAINLSAGKNLAGTFYQPVLVLCDISLLDTLPVLEFRCGCGEVIKYGILFDRMLLLHLQEKGLDFDRESIIARCIELKSQIVSQDEFDRGQRQLLNLGHTIGHSIEKISGFTRPHGQSVATGIAIITRAARHMGICSEADAALILDTLQRFDLPTQTAYTPTLLAQHARSDKKRSGQHLTLIVPSTIGCCRLEKVSVDQLINWIEAGM